jgi:hypothetical protein
VRAIAVAACGCNFGDFFENRIYTFLRCPGLQLAHCGRIDQRGAGNVFRRRYRREGNRLALTSAGDIWVYELGRGSRRPVTFGGWYSRRRARCGGRARTVAFPRSH